MPTGALPDSPPTAFPPASASSDCPGAPAPPLGLPHPVTSNVHVKSSITAGTAAQMDPFTRRSPLAEASWAPQSVQDGVLPPPRQDQPARPRESVSFIRRSLGVRGVRTAFGAPDTIRQRGEQEPRPWTDAAHPRSSTDSHPLLRRGWRITALHGPLADDAHASDIPINGLALGQILSPKAVGSARPRCE